MLIKERSLEKQKPVFVLNEYFTTPPSPAWTTAPSVTATASGGVLNVVRTSSGPLWTAKTITLVAGTTYTFTFDFNSACGGVFEAGLLLGTTPPPLFTPIVLSSGTHSFTFTPTTSGLYTFGVRRQPPLAGACSFTLDNVKIYSLAASSDYRYAFNGMEKDDDIKGEGNSYDFGARLLDTRLGRWLTIDKYYKKYPSWSPYNFVTNCVVLKKDIGGNWDIEVHGFNDRARYGYGVAIVKDRAGNEIARFQVLLRGANHPSRGTFGDTPTGSAEIKGWRNDADASERSSYGPNPRLEFKEPGTGFTDTRTGEWDANDRTYIQMHGSGPFGTECDYQALGTTNGCIRAHNGDLKDLKLLVEELQASDPLETPGTFTITEDLTSSDYNGINYFLTPDDNTMVTVLDLSIENQDILIAGAKESLSRINNLMSSTPGAEMSPLVKNLIDDYNCVLKEAEERKAELQQQVQEVYNQYSGFESDSRYVNETDE